MLDAAGVAYEAVKPAVDEDRLKVGQTDARSLALQLAIAKAESVSGDWVTGSDSVATVDGRLFDKPGDRDEAAQHLCFFSGKTLELSSAVALAHEGTVEWSHCAVARLHVRPLSDEFIAQYLDAEWPEVAYCVGAFRMEGRGIQLFDSIDGDYFTILGMPLLPLLRALRERGLMPA